MKVTDNKELKLGEIVFCKLTYRYKGKVNTVDRVVYKNNGTGDWYMNSLKDTVEVLSVDIISRLGFENKNIGYTKAKRNDNNNRNNITGAYE